MKQFSPAPNDIRFSIWLEKERIKLIPVDDRIDRGGSPPFCLAAQPWRLKY